MKVTYTLMALGLMMIACGQLQRQVTPTIPESQTPAAALPTATPQPPPMATAEPPTEPPPSATPITGVPVPTLDPEMSYQEAMGIILEYTGSVKRDVTYCTVGGVALKMDVYLPKNSTGAGPLVIFIHGGGWSEGDKRAGEFLPDAPALLNSGFTVASLNYRLAPEYEFPAMIEDVKCAVRSFRAHAGDYGINPDKIGVWGSSAGGHLVNMLGVTDESAGFEAGEYLDQSSRVQAVLDMFGPVDLTTDFSSTFAELRPTVFSGFDLAKASPITYVTADDPPFLILHGDSDHIAPLSQSQNFYDSLIAAGVEAQFVIVHGAGHGFRTPGISPTRAELSTMIIDFFETNLK